MDGAAGSAPAMMDSGPSRNLSWAELAVHDIGRTPFPKTWLDRALALAAEFESLRDACARRLGIEDAPITVISAYRTAAQNASVGGAGASQHLIGRALDLAPPAGITVQEFGEIAVELAEKHGIIRGIGWYEGDGHLHIDLRPEDKLITWRG